VSVAFVVVYDANVLYPSVLRDLLIRIAQAGLVQAKWTHQILDEVALALPDPEDRHVLAAAVKAQAQVIVTANTKDFPASVVGSWNIEAKHPDQFVLDLIDLNRLAVYGAVQRIADSWRKPPGTFHDVLHKLERDGLVESVALLRS